MAEIPTFQAQCAPEEKPGMRAAWSPRSQEDELLLLASQPTLFGPFGSN